MVRRAWPADRQESKRAEPGVATPLPGGVRMELQHNRPTSTENDMTTDKKIARHKLSLLELAPDLGNVSKACRVMGYSRQQFYGSTSVAD